MTAESKPILPTSIIGPADLNRLLREAKSINERVSVGSSSLPAVSSQLQEFLEATKLSVTNKNEQERLIGYLQQLIDKLPSVHISLGSEPSADSLKPLVKWLRENIHPQLLVRIGLKPNLGAGCILRTKNKMFDFSLRHYLNDKQNLLVKQLQQMQGEA